MTSTPTVRHRNSLRAPETAREIRIEDLTERKLFKDVDADELRKMLANGSTRICKLGPRKELSPTAGEFAQVYVILDGYVVISTSSRFDSEDKTFLAWRGPEQIIGEMRPLDGNRPLPRSKPVMNACFWKSEMMRLWDTWSRGIP